MPNSMTAGGGGPLTPAKQTTRLGDGHFAHDSPFSDYFTDDARSIENISGGAVYNAPSSQTQQMLVRMSKLQAQLMRAGEEGQDVLNIVGRKLNEIESGIDALHSQTRIGADMDDSGLFMDDEEERDVSRPGSVGTAWRPRLEEIDVITPEERQAERDYQLVEAQRVLESVTRAQEELRQRHKELVELNNTHVEEIEDREQEMGRLRSENETLRADLQLDHSELLFMKLQIKALEEELDEEEENDSPVGKPSIRRPRRDQILADMNQWRNDWYNVAARFRRRRSKYGLDQHDDQVKADDDTPAIIAEGGEWQLETIKRRGTGGNRINSITSRRLSRTAQLDNTNNAEREPQVYSTHASTIQPNLSRESGSSTVNEDDIGDEDGEDAASDYAITTSPSTPNSASPLLAPQDSVSNKPLQTQLLPSPAARSKSAWKELWDGLSSFAGMASEDEEEGGTAHERGLNGESGA
ncbi:hypothetical protein LTR62_004499 [Meristemomyces frigidus]|uniref:Uncharacterized protein n=1 Tax=Meristemomyces frigidus TaxID=1508187 RepID=A0AAN7YG76_9PEZI|nr:hypothetical protein LTR62_004499 [Meristemomyces frigidus]